MITHMMTDMLNYGFNTTVLKQNDSSNFTADGYNANDLCIDYGTWRSKGVQDFDIYTEIYQAESISCCVIFGSNISSRASIVIAGSNASGVGGFNEPLFQEPFKYSQGKWVYVNNTNTELPVCKYYRISIYDPDPKTDYFEINKIFIGKSFALPVPIVDGFSDSNENHQKRTIVNGQWNPGNVNSILKTLDITLQPIAGLSRVGALQIEYLNAIIDTVKTTRPFVFILDINKPELFCEYMTFDGEEINIEVDEAERTTYSFTLKETK